MIDRYTRPEMGAIWTEQAQYAAWLEVELAAAEAMATLGQIPTEAMEDLRRAVPPDPERVREIERETAHDVIAFLEAIEEQIGPAARFLHMGLTSSDVLDTALALRSVRCLDLILAGCDRLIGRFEELAVEHEDLPTVGRSHGVHAEPMTLGLKFLRWHQEFARGRERLSRAREVIGHGQISGAIGTYSTVDPRVEEHVCEALELRREPVSSQVVPRDRHAEFLCHLAVFAAGVENVAVEIRHLQRTEVRELAEPFGKGQKGSSVMPHKRNPIKAENLTGLARLVRGYAQSALENVALWHERDISHSSVERVALADACILVDFMIHRLYGVVDGLEVSSDAMHRNLDLTNGLVFSSRVLQALLEAGLARTEAYRLVQRAAMECWESGRPFQEALAEDAEIGEHLGAPDLERCFDLDEVLGAVPGTYERVLGGTRATAQRPEPGDAGRGGSR